MDGLALAIMSECRRRGVILRVNAGRLQYRSKTVVPDDLADQLHQNTAEIVRALMPLDGRPTGVVHEVEPRNTPQGPQSDAPKLDSFQPGPDRLAGCDDDPDFAAWHERYVARELSETDRLGVALAMGDVSGWLYPNPAAAVVGVPDGWTADGWRRRLLTVADACAADHPERAAELRGMAEKIEKAADYPLAGIPGA